MKTKLSQFLLIAFFSMFFSTGSVFAASFDAAHYVGLQGQDPYTILGLRQGATNENIKKAYRKLAHRLHPDRNLNNQEQAGEAFKIVTAAYEQIEGSGDYSGHKGRPQAFDSTEQDWDLQKATVMNSVADAILEVSCDTGYCEIQPYEAKELSIKPFEVKVRPIEGPGEIVYHVKAPEGGWNLKPKDVLTFEREEDLRTGANVDKLVLNPDAHRDVIIELILDRKNALKTDQLADDEIADILNEGNRWW